MSVPCTDLKGLHTVVSNVIRGSMFTCFGNAVLACHDDCPSVSFPVPLIFFFSIPLKASGYTASPASLHDDLMKQFLRSWRYLMCRCGLQLLLSLVCTMTPCNHFLQGRRHSVKASVTCRLLSYIKGHGGNALSFCSACLCFCVSFQTFLNIHIVSIVPIKYC